jgi:hypothetical protein
MGKIRSSDFHALCVVGARSWKVGVWHGLLRASGDNLAKSSDDTHRKVVNKPYSDRSDLEKLQSQWNKLSRLHLRDEPSAASVRCATAAEIAANYAVRMEWARQTEFDAVIIDQFLRWANGLYGKVARLFVPVYFAHPAKSTTAKVLIKSSETINTIRNAVVHQSTFSNAAEAEEAIAEARTFINLIVGLSIPDFDIAAKAISK